MGRKALTTDQFILQARFKHGYTYGYDKVDYLDTKTRVEIVCDIHGSFIQKPFHHLLGSGCPKCANERQATTREDFILKSKEIHDAKYNYSKTIYVNSHTKVKVECGLHGEFLITPDKHLQGGGCQKCGGTQKFTLSDFIIRANNIHGDKYSYKKTNYINSKEKIEVTCPIHGDFKQEPTVHLQGCGCPQCGYIEHGGYSRTDYIKKAKNKLCTFYTLKCFNENEEFYKIGITMNSVKKRYPSIKSMPYSYEIVSEIKGEAGFIWDLELQEKRKLKEFRYQPSIKFGGSSTECFIKYE